MRALFEAFDDVTTTLETLARQGRQDDALAIEYNALRNELESEVIAECLAYMDGRPTEHIHGYDSMTRGSKHSKLGFERVKLPDNRQSR